MAKLTVDGLPVLTEQTYDEVLRTSLESYLESDRYWKTIFLTENDRLYHGCVDKIINAFPEYYVEIDSNFVPTYEMLRREGEKIGIKLPYVELRTITIVAYKAITNRESGKKYGKIIGAENPQYIIWMANVYLSMKEQNFPRELNNVCRDVMKVMYISLKEQAKMNKVFQSN